MNKSAEQLRTEYQELVEENENLTEKEFSKEVARMNMRAEDIREDAREFEEVGT